MHAWRGWGAVQLRAAADEPLAFARVSQQNAVTLGGRRTMSNLRWPFDQPADAAAVSDASVGAKVRRFFL